MNSRPVNADILRRDEKRNGAGAIKLIPRIGNPRTTYGEPKHALKDEGQAIHRLSFGAIPTEAAVLNSWKDIAAYLGRGVRTVQRWESELGLPVHRPWGKGRSVVFAFQAELDRWLRSTPLRPNGDTNTNVGSALLRTARKLQTLAEELVVRIDPPRRAKARRLANAAQAIVDELTSSIDGHRGERDRGSPATFSHG